ncbi:CMD domain protein [Leucobacter chromiireducens]|uniref:CMD domain protein n=1 Tax=Leucobacter chromiireducens TaxID=283877 RepID=UPI000F639B20|nr:CMD domain protein [Leucobacter chromiireducens]
MTPLPAGAPDVLDALGGSDPGSPIRALRAEYPRAREAVQEYLGAVLGAPESGAFAHRDRVAIALFVSLLHGFPRAVKLYSEQLGRLAPDWVAPLRGASVSAQRRGPAGAFREPSLRRESRRLERWHPSAAVTMRLGARLSAGLAYAHALVFRPRESAPPALARLGAAGWGANEIVSLTHLVAYLTFQLRAAWGLRTLTTVTPGLAGPGTDDFCIPPNNRACTERRRGRAAAAGTAVPPPWSAESGVGVSCRTSSGDAEAPVVHEYSDLARPRGFTQEPLGWVPWLDPGAANDAADARQKAAVRSDPFQRLLARDPGALRARVSVEREAVAPAGGDGLGGVSRVERELAALTVARVNGSVFDAAHHAVVAGRAPGRAADVQSLLDSGALAPQPDPGWQAVTRVAVALTETPLALGGDHVLELKAAGVSVLGIVDIVHSVAYANGTNRLRLALGEPVLVRQGE